MMYANDLGRAVTWYTEKLNFKARFYMENAYASLYHEEMNCRLDLHPTEAGSKDVGFGPIIYFLSDNLDRDLETLTNAGVKVGKPKMEGGSTRFVTFWDSEGNALGIEEGK